MLKFKDMKNNEKKIMLSGITATGQLTLGNYIGAIKNFVKYQNDYQMYVFVADLHALTIDIKPNKLRENSKSIMALYIAAGLDPSKTTLFNQSDVPAHSEMSWLLTTQTTMGELNRMTQFKDKSLKVKTSNGTEKIPTGLFTYPVLMSGDILLYDADVIPVGIDQKQHVELTKNLAERFNNKYGQTFTVPTPMIPKIGAKIMSLTDPTKKMSKSSEQKKSYISLLDDPEIAYNKIMKSVTDSENNVYLSEEKQGIKNLLTIYAALKDVSLEEAESKFKGWQYGEFKKDIANLVKTFLIDLQNKYKKALSNVENIRSAGAIKANKIANNKILEIKQKMGLI